MPISPYLKGLRDELGTRLLLLPGVSAVVFDDAGRVLLTERADNGRWALISGIMDPGEQPGETAVRECYEETAVHVVAERVIGVFSQPPTTYPNGDQCQFVDIAFRCRAVGGEARVNDDESRAVGWFALDDLPPLSDVVHNRIAWALDPTARTWFAGAPALHDRGALRD
jgi:8-oxo-dGTP pyrophosphatase MutT (NUDIX family)